MVEQHIRIGDILDVEQFHLRISLRVKVLVHILQHIFNTDLFAVANAPHAIKLQALDDGTLENKYGRSTRARHEIDALRIQMGNGQGKDTVVVAVQQSDTVRTNQGCTILLAGVEDTLLQDCTSLGLLAKAC